MGRHIKKENNAEDIINQMVEKVIESAPQEEKAANINSLSELLKKNKDDHLNFEEAVNYMVSTGSLILDAEIGGGISPGLTRLAGVTEAGKTSCSLEIVRNFLDLHKDKGKALLIKAEGRLSDAMVKRCGLKFVWDVKDWVAGTVFVLESNIYELIIDFLRTCVLENEEKNKYIFVLDSVDGLQLRDDAAKPIDGNVKVAGVALLSKLMLKRLSNTMSKLGHILLMLSQHTTQISINPYAPKEFSPIQSSGGNGLSHFSNQIFEFAPKYKSKLILQDDTKPIDRVKNRPLGHYCKVTIKKSTNETTEIPVEYPVKYGVVGRSSVWAEKEIADFALMNSLITRQSEKGSIYLPDSGFREEIERAGFKMPEKFKGIESISEWLESDNNVTQFLFKKFKDILAAKIK